MKLSLKAGTTSKSVAIFIQNNSVTTGAGLTGLVYNTSSLTAYYVQPGSNAAAITLATLAAANSAWSSGGFKEVDATNMPGVYRLDIPNAALTGATSVVIMLKGATNMAPCVLEIELTAWDNQDSVRGGMTAMPNAAAGANGGLPTVDANNRVAGIQAISNITAWTVAITGNITGNLSGSVASVTGAVGSVTGLTASNLDATISSRMATTHIAATAGKVDGVALVDTTTTNSDMRGTDSALLAVNYVAPDNAGIGAIQTVTDNLPDSGALTSIAQASNLATAQSDLDTLTGVDGATLATLQPNFSPSTLTAADVWSYATRILTAGTNIGFPSAATIASAVWDALTSALTTVGSAGKLLVDNLNATVSSRLASAGYTAPDNTGIGAIQAKTDNLPADPSSESSLQTYGDTNWGTATGFATPGDVPTANQNADALLDRSNAVETGLTPRGAFRLALAALAGKVSGGATSTNTFRNAVADSKDRITATVDTDGNRTSITTDVT